MYSSLDLLITLAVVVAFVAYALVVILVKRMGWHVPFIAPKPIDSPAIWGAADSKKQIIMLDYGQLGGYQFVLSSVFSFDSKSFMVLSLELSKSCPFRIVSVNKHSPILTETWKTELAHQGLESVNLEGDFPDYFNLYASRDLQTEVRELFNPKQMAYAIDFCQNFDFEVFDSTLLVAINRPSTDGDTTAAVEDAVVLAEKLEHELKGWSHLLKAQQPKHNYDPMAHFKGDTSKIQPGSYVQVAESRKTK